MGAHKLNGVPEPLQLQQVLPPGLEDRALMFAPLTTLQQKTPGYFDAPGAHAAAAAGCVCVCVPHIVMGDRWWAGSSGELLAMPNNATGAPARPATPLLTHMASWPRRLTYAPWPWPWHMPQCHGA